ncbi:MAG TPA: alpha/beta hydrolase [Vicinamibacterales bacterium]|nr:alpha/beta hydrolase [Vicinamibacterales bacterium]
MTLSFIHRYEPPARPGLPTLLLLHGTGGDENDLLPLGRNLMPDAGMLSPRGKILEQGMPRFFRRLAEGVFDVEDLKRRTAELADFIAEAADHYGFDARRVVAVGFSNGANIAASLLLSRPGVLAAAVLFRAMVPFVPDAPPPPSGASVLLSNGSADPFVPAAEIERLASLLRAAGADVTVEMQPAGHHLTQRDVTRARDWLASLKLAEGIRA